MIVREARCEDVGAIAQVHVESWRTTYRGLMPDAVLDGLTPEQRRPQWEQQLCSGRPLRCTFVATDAENRVVGFASAGPQRDMPAYDGELYAIYLPQSVQRQGTGRRLVASVARCLIDRGMRSMLLWVLASNHPSRAFYERLGGTYVQTKPYEIGGATLREVAYGWPDLAALLRSLEPPSATG